MKLILSAACPDIAHLLETAQTAARTAGTYAHEHFQGPMTVDHKARQSDVVTIHDRRAEQIVRDIIAREAPQSRIWGEEYGSQGEGDVVWFVDPIDGTSNFAGGLPLYCVSIGIAWRGELVGGVIYDAARDEMFVGSTDGLHINGKPAQSQSHPAEADAICLTNFPYEGMVGDGALVAFGGLLSAFRAVRRLGSSALALAYVAAGRADICCELSTKPWDHAAGAALVLAGGGGFEGRGPDFGVTTDISAVTRFAAHGRGFDLETSVVSALLKTTEQRPL